MKYIPLQSPNTDSLITLHFNTRLSSSLLLLSFDSSSIIVSIHATFSIFYPWWTFLVNLHVS